VETTISAPIVAPTRAARRSPGSPTPKSRRPSRRSALHCLSANQPDQTVDDPPRPADRKMHSPEPFEKRDQAVHEVVAKGLPPTNKG